MKHLNYKTLLLTVFFLLSISALTGCSKPQTPETLHIGLMSDAGAIPFLIAKENGFFEEQGLDVQIDVFKSALDRDSALQTGNLDGAMADMLAAVFFYNSGQPMAMASSTYGNYTLVSSPLLDEKALLSMDKVSVGLSSNTVIDYTTDKIALHNGFESTLEKVAIPQMPIRLEMLSAGKLNGATLPNPLSFAALVNGGEVIGSTVD